MRLHVHEWGDPGGEPLVCLHGLTGHGARFRRLALRFRDRRVVAPDLRGHGRSGWEPPWSTRAHVEDALDTADALGIGSCDWIGFSFGGRVLAALAAAAPERVRRAVLLDPALHVAPSVCAEWADLERQEHVFESHEEAIEARLGSGTLVSTPRELLVEEMADHLVEREDGRFEYRYSQSAGVAAWSEMAEDPPPIARVPTLLVVGEESWLEVDTGRYRAALGEAVEIVVLPGGHSLLWDALDETTEAVARFLSAAPRGPAHAGAEPG